jgi:hypothetical protein
MEAPTCLVSNCCPSSKVQHHVASANTPELFQMLLAARVPSKCQPVEAASQLPHESVAKCRLIQLTEQTAYASGPPVQSFTCDTARVVGTDWLQSLHRERNTTPPCHQVMSFCCAKLAEMTLEIHLYELTTPFEHCILETERMELGEIV